MQEQDKQVAKDALNVDNLGDLTLDDFRVLSLKDFDRYIYPFQKNLYHQY